MNKISISVKKNVLITNDNEKFNGSSLIIFNKMKIPPATKKYRTTSDVKIILLKVVNDFFLFE